MSIAALNAALKILNGLAIAVTKSVTDTAGAIDAYGGDPALANQILEAQSRFDAAVKSGAPNAILKELKLYLAELINRQQSGGDPRGGDGPGGDVLHTATGGDGGITDSGARPSFQSGLRMTAAVVAAAKKEIVQHTAESKKAIDSTVDDALQGILDQFNSRDKGLMELLAFIDKRVGIYGTSGHKVLMQVVQMLGDMEKARAKGDGLWLMNLTNQLNDYMKFLNTWFLSDPRLGQIDLSRLMGSHVNKPVNPTNSANSTGKS